MACTAFPAPPINLFINNVQGVWTSVNEAKGTKSATYSSGTLVVNGPNGSTGPITPGANQMVRHKFFGAGDFMAVCISDTGAGPKSHRVSLINFLSSPTSIVSLFTTLSDNNPPLPFVQFDQGQGAACCIGGEGSGQIWGLAIYRADTGEVLCPYMGGGYITQIQILGEAVAAGVQIKDGGNIIAGPCPIPSGELDVQPNSLSFNDVVIGGCPQPPSTKTFTLKNIGNGCLTINAIGNVAPYSVSSTSQPLPATLAPNETLTVTVTFAPGAIGTFNNVNLPVTRTPAKGDDKLICSGKSVQAQAAFTVTPSSMNFGSVQVGQTSGTKLVTIQNTGSVPISISAAGAPAGTPFQWSGLNVNLSCGQSQTIAVTFAPQAEGPAASQTITVISTPGGSKTVTLNGTGCVPNAQIVVPAAFPVFGQVRQGYRMPRFFTIQNSGDGTLTFTARISGPDAVLFGLMTPSQSITNVLSTQTYSIDPVSSCGSGSTGTGKVEVVVVFHANANPPKHASAILTIESHNDPTAPASITRGLDADIIAGNTVDVVAVFDTSGSMSDSVQGGGTKMAAAIQAGKMLVKLIPPDLHNRIAATRFSTTANTFLPIDELTSGNQQGKADDVADPPLTPNGSTAIAAGAMTGMKEFATPNPGGPQPNLTKAMIVLTDGMDNTAFKNPDDGLFYSILGEPARDPGNLSDFISTNPFVPPSDVKIYAVGLGTGQNIDMNQLSTLSSGAGGYYGAVDPTQPAVAYQLIKYYTQIYMDMVDTSVIQDPKNLIYPGQKHVIEFNVLAGDVGGTVVMYDFGGLRLAFWLETPQGDIVDAAFVPSGFQLRSGFTETTRFLDFRLPWGEPKRYAGVWKLIVLHDGQACTGNPSSENKTPGFRPRKCRPTKNPIEYGFAIGVGSNFRLQAYLTPGPVKVGEPIRLTGIPTEAGLPVTGCAVTVDARSPSGQLWPGIVLPDDGFHQDGDANDGEYARLFTQTAEAGSYTFTFRATGFSRDGEPVTREAVRSKYVEGWVRPPVDPGDNCCKRLEVLLRKQNHLLTEILTGHKQRTD